MTDPRPPQTRSTPEQALRAAAASLGGAADDLELVAGRPSVGVLALPDEAVRLRVAPPNVDRRQLERVHRLLATPAMVEAAVAPGLAPVGATAAGAHAAATLTTPSAPAPFSNVRRLTFPLCPFTSDLPRESCLVT